MRDAFIIGAAMTRFAKRPDSTIRSLAEDSVRMALADACIGPSDVQSVFFANAVAGLLTGQEMIRGQVALRHTGLLGLPIVNIENACASGSTAFSMAVAAVRSGAVDIAIAVGSEKMTHVDKRKTFAAIGSAVDLLAVSAEGPTAVETGRGSRSPFMDIYAEAARAYMLTSGATERDLADVAVKAHFHGSLNPDAQYRETCTAEQVLASPEIASPLTLLMCSPIGDGAATLVVASEAVVARLGATPVKVDACVLMSGRDRARTETGAVELAARRAYEVAGIGPSDVHVVELHDAAAPAELITTEELGLCARGDGPALLRSGATTMGGRVPVNPSGGLLSKGHPIGATGCAQIVELVDQLRARCGARQVEGARVALAENGGGSLGLDPAAVVITILSA